MSTSNPQQPPSFLGIHHLKLPTASLAPTVAFYTTHLPFIHLTHLDHIDSITHQTYAQILHHAPTKTTLEIRLDADQAAKQTHWDPITWLVQSRADLDAWREYFLGVKEQDGGVGVAVSRVFTGVTGWVLCVEDPDGRVVRFYTVEEHAITQDVDRDARWLGN